MKKIFIYAVLIGMWIAPGLYCENTAVAMVGNKIVLESDVRLKMQEANNNYEEALRDVVIENMLLFEADKERIEVVPEELAFEIEQIKQRFPDEASFYAALEKDNMPYSIFANMLENQLKVKKVIKKNVIDKIEVPSFEIAEKIKEFKESGSYLYSFRLKWFEDELSAQEFIDSFDITKEEEMGNEGVLSKEEISPEVLAELDKLSPGNLSSPIKIGDRYLVILLKDVEKEEIDSYQLYLRVRSMLLNMKFEENFNNYLRELQLRIPVFYCE